MTDDAIAEAALHGDGLGHFLDKWRARWPEWAIAEVFVPPAQRQSALAWAALQQELGDAAWGGSDPRPGEAKLAWWREELLGWGRGARRHPLGEVLQRQPAPWAALAAALPTLAASRERPRDADEAFAQLQRFAATAAEVDLALFEPSRAPAAADREAVVATLLQARLAVAGEDAVPLGMFAQAGEGERLARWAARLHERWPRDRAGSRARRLWAALARARLGRGDPARPLPPWTTLPLAWRAARD